MKRNEMLVNIIAQLVHSPDKTTATHIKNFISAPADQWDKPGLVAALWATLKDETEVDTPGDERHPMEGQENSVTPNDDNRSMVEQCLIDALDDYIASGNETVRQLAQLAKDLIQLTGDQPIVRDYINMKAALALDEESSAW